MLNVAAGPSDGHVALARKASWLLLGIALGSAMCMTMAHRPMFVAADDLLSFVSLTVFAMLLRSSHGTGHAFVPVS